MEVNEDANMKVNEDASTSGDMVEISLHAILGTPSPKTMWLAGSLSTQQ